MITNNLNAVFFEKNMASQIKRELLFDFVSGGIIPPNFIVNINFVFLVPKALYCRAFGIVRMSLGLILRSEYLEVRSVMMS